MENETSIPELFEWIRGLAEPFEGADELIEAFDAIDEFPNFDKTVMGNRDAAYGFLIGILASRDLSVVEVDPDDHPLSLNLDPKNFGRLLAVAVAAYDGESSTPWPGQYL